MCYNIRVDRQRQDIPPSRVCRIKDKAMLENSNLISGTQAKELDKLLQEYTDLTSQLTDLETSKKNVLARIFELAPVGLNETSKYTFKVLEQAGRQSISVKNLSEQAPDLFGKISGLGLVSIGEDFKTLRSVKVKGDRV